MKLLTKIFLMGTAGLLLFTADAFAGIRHHNHNSHNSSGYSDDSDAVYKYTFSSNELLSLEHGKAYTWGIDNTSNWLQPDQTITAARLIFENIYDYSYDDTNALFVHLLDNADPGVSVFSDSHHPISDYFEANGTDDIKLAEWFNISDKRRSPDKLVYNFTTGSNGTIQLLMDFMGNGGSFGLGFDPDCHFFNTGVSLEIQTSKSSSQEPVPEPSTILLLGTGLLGFSGLKRFRKKSQ